MKQHILLYLLILNGLNGFSQNKYSAKLNEVIINLDSSTSSNPLYFLDDILKDKQILALGENTHGTKDYFVKKTEIIKYCITNLGFNTVIFEADAIGAKAIDEYIVNENGNLNDALFTLGTKAWMTKEVKSLIAWLSAYNQTKSENQKVRF